MANQSTHPLTGITVFSLLTIVFITLRLMGVIEWSWWLVLAPLWGPFALVLLALVVAFVMYVWLNS